MSDSFHTRARGNRGEERAVAHLTERGFRILERNWRLKLGEIDLIAESPDGFLTFVEVKTSYGNAAGDPAFWVNKKKQRKIWKMAEAYMAIHRMGDRPCRFDVVAVHADEGWRVDHYEDAFRL